MPVIAFHVGATGVGSKLEIGGKDLSKDIRAVTIRVEVGEPSTMIIEYMCFEAVIDGTPTVVHRCPIVDPDEASS